jgi:oxygen-independent coproporphyrinogen III oxidase
VNGATPASRLGLYVHIPFCPQRCPYCAFTVVTGHEDMVADYVDAVCREIETWTSMCQRRFDTVFFGGGTPSRLEPAQLARILDTADSVVGLQADAEVTVEANPTTADATHFAELRQAGCNRLSLGAQSFQDDSLRRLGRMHNAAEAEGAYHVARSAGFASVSFDLIFSVPGADANDWRETLARAVDLAPDHLSAYALSVEPGTPFERRRQEGDLPVVDEETDAAAYEQLVQTLVGSGYEHYEISNFARPGHRSRHNWDCWTGGEYIGVGLSAHSFLAGRRFWNGTNLEDYIARVSRGDNPCVGEEHLPDAAARGEAVWLALRTCQGVELGFDERERLVSSELWIDLQTSGHVQLDGDRLWLTESGLAVADALSISVIDVVVEDVIPVTV